MVSGLSFADILSVLSPIESVPVVGSVYKTVADAADPNGSGPLSGLASTLFDAALQGFLSGASVTEETPTDSSAAASTGNDPEAVTQSDKNEKENENGALSGLTQILGKALQAYRSAAMV